MCPIRVFSEYQTLKKVIIGSAKNHDRMISDMLHDLAQHPERMDAHLINPRMREIYEKKNKVFAKENELEQELSEIRTCLSKHGVEVLSPLSELVPEEPVIFARDLAVVIGDMFVLSRLSSPFRDREKAAIVPLLQNSKVVVPPDGVVIEGGDVLITDRTLLVGYGSRTNWAGVEFLQKTFSPAWDVIPFELIQSPDPKIHSIHLDCALNILAKDTLFIYPPSFAKIPTFVYDHFPKRIEIAADEFYDLAGNVLSIAPGVVCIDHKAKRLHRELGKRHFTPIPLKIDQLATFSGGLRCVSLPLIREMD
jgi:N-dimethylarginine dimethylaminohydrolase